MEIKQLIIEEKRPSNIYDQVSISANQMARGQVQIFEKTKDGQIKLEDKNNLVVYVGRNWLMQRAMNRSVTGTPGVNTFISWLGLGIGGATSANPLNPLLPALADEKLNQQIVINGSATTDCVDNGKLHPFDSIAFNQDENNQDQTLIASITTTIGDNDANGPTGSTGQAAYYDISEAGLYISNSNDALIFDVASIKLFAKVTFSSIRKFSDRQLVFVWKIFF